MNNPPKSMTLSDKGREKDLFPSLKINENKRPPHGWIQWKGTDVCMDVYCKCGHHGHIDADFTYHIKCPKCGAVYECSGYIDLYKLDFEPENTKTIEL